MSNELLLIISLFLYIGTFVILFKFFGKLGAFFWVIIATLFANIEVLLNINAFGIDMTLGNVLFGSTFLATDVLSERYGRKSAEIAVKLGVITTFIYIIFSQFWLLFTPNEFDFVYDSMVIIFSPLMRVAIVGLVVYYIAQKIDIFVYHYIWDKTTKKSNDKDKYLWLRNNGSTLITQFVNSLLFTYLSFSSFNLGFVKIEGMYPSDVVFSIFISTWIIMSVLAFIDTPFCYLCRKLKVKEYIEIIE